MGAGTEAKCPVFPQKDVESLVEYLSLKPISRMEEEPLTKARAFFYHVYRIGCAYHERMYASLAGALKNRDKEFGLLEQNRRDICDKLK